MEMCPVPVLVIRVILSSTCDVYCENVPMELPEVL